MESYVSGGTEWRRMRSARELSEVTGGVSLLPATSVSSREAPLTDILSFVGVTHPPLPLAETNGLARRLSELRSS